MAPLAALSVGFIFLLIIEPFIEIVADTRDKMTFTHPS